MAAPGANHLTLDKDGKLRQVIVQKVLEVCRERSAAPPASILARKE